jgi:hypothetical protein
MLRVMNIANLRALASSGVFSARLTVLLLLLASCFANAACSDDKPSHAQPTQKSSGDESVVKRAAHDVKSAGRDLRDTAMPAADWVDNKGKEVVKDVDQAVSDDKPAPKPKKDK